MKFNILERLMILRILPQETDLASARIIADLKKETGFTQEEMDKVDMVIGDNVKWEGSKDYEKEIKIVNRAAEIIIKVLNGLSKSEKVSEEYLSIFDKFGIETEATEEDTAEYKPKEE